MENQNRRPEGSRESPDEQMERDTQVRPGGQAERSTDRDEAIPEFGRLDDEDRTSDR